MSSNVRIDGEIHQIHNAFMVGIDDNKNHYLKRFFIELAGLDRPDKST
jgi:hypothetical protein